MNEMVSVSILLYTNRSRSSYQRNHALSGRLSQIIGRHREALNATKRIADLTQMSADVFVWKQWQVDVMAIVDEANISGESVGHGRMSWLETARKGEIAGRR